MDLFERMIEVIMLHKIYAFVNLEQIRARVWTSNQCHLYVLRQQIIDIAHLQHIGCKRVSIQNRSRTNRTVAVPYCIFATYVAVAHNVHTL